MASQLTDQGQLLKRVKNCQICTDFLPLKAKPILQFSASAKILIAGQAPGLKAHKSGIPFDDASGKRLRQWLDIDPDIFYDTSLVAILPMGFCYPGSTNSGDLAPRIECAQAWREEILSQLKALKMTLVLGQYAQNYHFENKPNTLTELVKSWQQYWPKLVPLPHPSPRNNRWLKQNPWFEEKMLPELKARIRSILKD